MAYTRQYTQGVGWENTPSINTPISAENLNQMDEAIQDVDEAAYNEFAAVYQAIENGIGAECSGHEITGLASNNEAIYADIMFDDDIVNHDTHIFFLTSEYAVPEKSDSPYYWRLWVRYKVGSTTMGQNIMIYDMDGEPFDGAIPVGNQFICQLHIVDPSDSTTWYISELANISASGGGGGGCRIFSDHITEQNDTNLYTSTNVFDGTTSQDGDLLFLRCDVNAVWPSPPLPLPGWGISFGHGSVEYGSITDARRGEGSVMPGFYDSISSGTTLIISKHGNNDWWLRAVIPAESEGGGTHTDAINFKITSASSNTLVPVAFQRIAAPLNDGDLVFLYMSVNGTFDSEASATSWQLQYKLTDSTTITGPIANGLGSPSVSIFNSNLPQGTWLVLRSGVYDSTTYTQGFTCIAKIDPASGGGAGNNVFTWDSQYTDASTGDFEVTLSEMPSFSVGDILVLKIHANLTYTGSGGWGFLITIGSSGEGWSGIAKKVSTVSGSDVVDFTDDLSRGTCLTFICTDVANSGMPTLLLVSKDTGEGGASSLAGLSDTTISSPTAAQPLTYDATNSKWINGGIIPAANGGTGNATGYVQAGRKANTNIGNNATAEGQNTTASGNQSHAEGYNTQATGHHAHVEGENSKATSGTAHAEGANTTASGMSSHAQGNGTTASGSYSSAAGRATTAGYIDQFVVGKYNNNKSTSIFEVGIGTGSGATPRINGLELDTSGNLKTAGTITDGNGNVLGQPVAVDGVWVISGETATLTATTP